MLEIHAIFYFFIIGFPKDHHHRFSANVSIRLLTQKSRLIYIPPEFFSFSINHSSISTTSEVKKRPFYSTAVLLIIAPIDWPCLIVPLRKHTKLELHIKSYFTSSIINQLGGNFPVQRPNRTKNSSQIYKCFSKIDFLLTYILINTHQPEITKCLHGTLSNVHNT